MEVKSVETKTLFKPREKNLYFLFKQSDNDGNYKARLYKFSEDGSVEQIRSKSRETEKGKITIIRKTKETFSKLIKEKNFTDFEIIEQISEKDYFKFSGDSSFDQRLTLKTFEMPKNIFGRITFQGLSPLAKKYIRKIGEMFTKIK